MVAEHLSVEEVAGLKDAFHTMDINNRGKINLEEFKTGLHKLGHHIADADVQILMEAVSIIRSECNNSSVNTIFLIVLTKANFPQADLDGDGSLNYGEFVAVSVHLRKMANDEHLHKAFSFFDKNESGYIEIEELEQALADDILTNIEEVIHGIMHDVDTDKVNKLFHLPKKKSAI